MKTKKTLLGRLNFKLATIIYSYIKGYVLNETNILSAFSILTVVVCYMTLNSHAFIPFAKITVCLPMCV